MCNVCVALDILSESEEGSGSYCIGGPEYRDGADRIPIYVQTRDCAGAEFEPGELRFRREGSEDWSPWVPFTDLASSADVLGGDVAWQSLAPEVRAWASGEGELQPVLDLLEARRQLVLAPSIVVKGKPVKGRAQKKARPGKAKARKTATV